MQKKKYWLVFGAVVISLLMISSATAINVIETRRPVSSNKQVYIDPNICLTRGQVSKLQQAIPYISDRQDKAIVQEIIQRIQIKGKVDSQDISNIVYKLNIYDRSFYTGFVSASGGAGLVGGFPIHFIRALIFFIFAMGGSFGTILVGSWNVIGGTHNVPNCEINGRTIFYSQPNKGLALLGFGIWGYGYWGGPDCSFSGLFALIIVSPV